MIKKKQTFSKIIIISLIIALTIFRSIYAFAITLSEDKGELNIFIEGLLPANPVKIKMKLYRIKEITDSKEENLLKDEIQEESTEKIKEVEEANSNELNFKFTKEFKDIANIDERLKEDSEEYVEEIKKFATDNKIQCIEEEVDYLTHAHFADLELGKYLVVIDDFIMDNELFECNSFIVTIPMIQNEKYEFTINANPKVSEIIINPPDDQNNVNNTPTNTDTNTNVITNSSESNNANNPENPQKQERKRLPDTGLPIVSVIVLSILGLICIVVGCILDKRTRKK